MRPKHSLAIVALLGVIAVAASSSVSADSPPSFKGQRVYEDPAGGFSWGGFYLGVHAGASWDNSPVGLSPASALANPYINFGAVPSRLHGDHDERFIGGGQLGFNWQTGHMVYGIEVDYSGLAGDGDQGTVNTSSNFFAPFRTTASSKVDQLGTLRARLGVALSQRTLLYTSGGLAFGNTHLSSSINTPTFPCGPQGLCANGSASGWEGGWAAGGGIEHVFSRHIIIRAEYLHYDLGTHSFNSNDTGNPAIVFNTKAKFDGDILRSAINFKF